jgi:uncharacterized protein YecT (DUF1311 family)
MLMRVIALAAALSAASLSLTAAPVSAQTAPLNCVAAVSATELAICADAELVALDRSVREAYIKALGRLDRDSVPALQKDQKAFLDERTQVLEKNTMPLATYLRQRRDLLDTIENPAWSREASAFLGTWKNSLGMVRVTLEEGGRLVVQISTLSPAEMVWICDIESVAALPRNGRVTFTEDEVKVTLSRRGSALVVGDEVPQGDGGRSFCGSNGYIDGAYFKVR